VGQHGLGGQPGADHPRCDPLPLQRVDQARRVADQQHVPGRRRGPGAAHPQPAAGDRPRRDAWPDGAALGQQRAEPGQVAAQRCLPAGGAQPNPDAHVRLPVRTGEQPAVAGVDPPWAGIQQDQQRQRHLGGQVGADREPPQRGVRVEHPGEARERAQRPVRADDDVGGQPPAVARDDRTDDPVAVGVHGGDPGLDRDRPGGDGRLAQGAVEDQPRHHHPVIGVAPARERGELAGPPGRADRQQVASLARVGNADAQFREYLHAARADQVATRLVAGEGSLVGERDAGPAAGEHQGGDAAGRARPHHDRVEGPLRH
jgi:hypothetical protein